MANGFNPIKRETFEGMDEVSKLSVLFDYISDIHNRCQSLEQRKRMDTTLAGTAGFIGGVVAHIAQWIMSGGQKPV